MPCACCLRTVIARCYTEIVGEGETPSTGHKEHMMTTTVTATKTASTTTLNEIIDGNPFVAKLFAEKMQEHMSVRSGGDKKAELITAQDADGKGFRVHNLRFMLYAAYEWGQVSSYNEENQQAVLDAQIPATYTYGEMVDAMHAVRSVGSRDVEGRRERGAKAAAMIILALASL